MIGRRLLELVAAAIGAAAAWRWLRGWAFDRGFAAGMAARDRAPLPPGRPLLPGRPRPVPACGAECPWWPGYCRRPDGHAGAHLFCRDDEWGGSRG